MINQKSQRRNAATFALVVVFAFALMTQFVATPDRAAAAPAKSTLANLNFPATGHSIKTASFINFFQAYGGVQTFGYPLAEETWENGHLVQYFERQRFEYHPENAGTEYEVLLGRLGAEATGGRSFPGVAAFGNSAGRVYVAATQHSVAQPFLNYWNSHGGVRILGYPISEVVSENGLQVQYFERARLERHPENAGSAYEVLGSLLGRDMFQRGQAPAPAPAPAQGSVNAQEAQLLAQINGARQAAGLPAVTLDTQLISLARDRSADMANRNYFDHVTPDGKNFLNMMKDRSISYALAGEIIAKNNYPSAQSEQKAYEGFMNSAEHHGIIMMNTWRTAGVGMAVDGKGMYYFTVIFEQPR